MIERSRWVSLLVVCLFLASAGAERAEAQVITEFLASNSSSLQDEDGETSDWVEIYNNSADPVNLLGWSLTDDVDVPGKWLFPDVTLPPGEFLVVFLSGKDRSVPTEPLHTNFQLSPAGEYLALVNAELRPVSAFSPRYPEQIADSSFGHPMDVTARDGLSDGATARWLVPENSDLDATWTDPDLDDSAWQSGPIPLGFDRKETPTFADLVASDLGDAMHDAHTSVYVRIPFEVSAADLASFPRLRVRYDDAFVAFLNGVEVARSSTAPTRLRYSSRAVRARPNELERSEEVFPITTAGLLREGRNILAVHAMTSSRTRDDDFLLAPALEFSSIEGVRTDEFRYFAEPTPGLPNGEASFGIAEATSFSPPPGAFTGSIQVELSGNDPDTVLRYTTDGTDPTATSAIYTEPILVEEPVTIKARAFREGFLPGAVVVAPYAAVDSTVLDFTSDIPIVVCTTDRGRPIGSNCGGGNYTTGQVLIFTPGDDGRTRLTGAPHFADLAAFRKRGSSTCSRPKFSFNLEVRKSPDEPICSSREEQADKTVQIFDFPPDSDYVMYGPYNFDRALMRNAIAYWMSRQVGQWAARTRFVECFFHGRVGPVVMTSYLGVYVFMEKNKRGPDRVDIELLTGGQTERPDIEGGYILRRDRVGQCEVTTSAGGYGNLVFVYPKAPNPQQRAFITGYVNSAINGLGPNIGSQEDLGLIDFQGWIDHHILNWYPKNVDAFRLSGYFYKARSGPLVMGPVWDYDRTMGCADDDRAANPLGFDNNSSGDGGTRYFGAGGLGSWYSVLFQNHPPTGNDPWARAYRARWRELRNGPLRTANILGQIDAWGAELAEAAERNFQKWRGTRPRFGGFQGEVDHLKDWLATRADWIDSQFIEPPTISPEGGRVAENTTVTIVSGDGTAYYTLDGSDPKGADGLPSAEAREYTGPLQVSENVRVRARSRVGERVWSNVVEAVYVTRVLPLAVTEIMYNPQPDPSAGFGSTGSAFEFLELRNVGTETIDLTGVSLPRQSFNFDDGDLHSVEPGGYLLVVRNPAAFAHRYGDGLPVAGAYRRTLSNTRATITVEGPLGNGEEFLSFGYDDDWEPTTDGEGYSLVIRDDQTPFDAWGEAENWRASTEIHGSPGRSDGPDTSGGLQRPGDFDQSRSIGVTDAVGLLFYLFRGTANAPCQTDAGNRRVLDVNGDDGVNASDAIYLLEYVFRQGPAPTDGVSCRPVPGCPDACGASPEP